MSRAPWRSLETKEGSLPSRKWLTNESLPTKCHGSRPPFIVDQRAVTLSPQSNRHIGRRHCRPTKTMTMECMLPSSNGIHEKNRYNVSTMDTADYSAKTSLNEPTQAYFSQSGRPTDSQHTNRLNNFSNCPTSVSQDHLLSESSRESQGKALPTAPNCHTNAVQQLFKLLSSSTYRGTSPLMYGNATTRGNSGSEKNAYVTMFSPALEGVTPRNSLPSVMSEKTLVNDSSRFQHASSSITPQENSMILPPQGTSMMHGSLSNLAELLTHLQGKQAPVAASSSFGNVPYLNEPVQKTTLFIDGHQNNTTYGEEERMTEAMKPAHMLHNGSQLNVKMFQETNSTQPGDFSTFYESHAYPKEYSEDHGIPDRVPQDAYLHRKQREESQSCETLSKYSYQHAEYHDPLQRNAPGGVAQLPMPANHASRRMEQRSSGIQPKCFSIGKTLPCQPELLRHSHGVLPRHHHASGAPDHLLKTDSIHFPMESQQHFNQQHAASYTKHPQQFHAQDPRNATLTNRSVNGGSHFLNSQHEPSFQADHSHKFSTVGQTLHGSVSQQKQRGNGDASYTVSPHGSRLNDASEQLRFSSQLQSIISRLSKDQMRSTGSSTEGVAHSHAAYEAMHVGREQTSGSQLYDKSKPFNNRNMTERWNPSNVSQWAGVSHSPTPSHLAPSQHWTCSHLNSRIAPEEPNRLSQPMTPNFNGKILSSHSKVNHSTGYDTATTQILSSPQSVMNGLANKSLKRDHVVKNGEKYPFARNTQASRPSLNKPVWSPNRSRHLDKNRWTDNDKRATTNSDTSRWTSRLKDKYSSHVSKVSVTRNPGKLSLHRGRHKETFKVTRILPSRQTPLVTSRYSRFSQVGKSPRHAKDSVSRNPPLRSTQSQQTSFKKENHLHKFNSKVSPKKTRHHVDIPPVHNPNSNSFGGNETQKLETHRLKSALRQAKRTTPVSSQPFKKHSKVTSDILTLYDEDFKKKMALFFGKTLQQLINDKENLSSPLLLTRVEVSQKSEKEINATSCRVQNTMPTFWVMSLLYYLETMWSRLRDTLLQQGCPRLVEKFSPCLLITNLPNVNACALQRALSNHFKSLRLPVDKFYLPVYPETGFSMGWCILQVGSQWKQVQNIISAPQFQWRGMCSHIHPFPCPQFLQLNASLTIASHRSKTQAAVNVGDWQPTQFQQCANIIYPPIKSFIQKIRVETAPNTPSFQTSYIGNPVPFMVISSNRRLKFSIPIAAPNYSAYITSLLLEDELKTIACSFPSNLCLPLTDHQEISYSSSSSIPTKCTMVDVNHQQSLDLINENPMEQRPLQVSQGTTPQPTPMILNSSSSKNAFSEEIDIFVSSPKTCKESLVCTMVMDSHEKETAPLQQSSVSKECQMQLTVLGNPTKHTTAEDQDTMLEKNLNVTFQEQAVHEISLVDDAMHQEKDTRLVSQENLLHAESFHEESTNETFGHTEPLNETCVAEKTTLSDHSSDHILVQNVLHVESFNENPLLKQDVSNETCVTCPAGTELDMEVSHSDEDSSSLNCLLDMKMKQGKNEIGLSTTCPLDINALQTPPPTTWGMADPSFFFSEEHKTNCYPTILSTSHSGTNQVSKRHGLGKVSSSRVLFPELPSIPHDGESAVVKPITKEDDFGFLSLFQHGHHCLLSWELLLQFLHVYLMWFRTIAENKLDNPAITSVASWSFFFGDDTEGLSMQGIWQTLYKVNAAFQVNLTDVVPLSHVLQITRIPNVKRTDHEFVKKLQEAIFTRLNLNEKDYGSEVWGPQYYIFAETERFRGNALLLLPSQQPVSSILSSKPTCEPFNLLDSPYTIQVEVAGATYPVEITQSLRPSVEIDWDLQIICKMVSIWSSCAIKQFIQEHATQLSYDDTPSKSFSLTSLVTDLPTFTQALSLEMDELTNKIQLEQIVGRLTFDLSICSAFHFLQTYFFSLEQFFTLPLFQPYIKVIRQVNSPLMVQNQLIRVTPRLYQRLQNSCHHTLPNIFLDPSTRAIVHYKQVLQLFNIQDNASLHIDSFIASFPEAEIPINDLLHHLRNYIQDNFNYNSETLDLSQKKHHLQWLMFENEPDWQATVRIPAIQFTENLKTPTYFETVGTTFPSPSKAKAACALHCLKYFANLEETLFLALGVKEHADDWMDIRCVDERSTMDSLTTAEPTSTISIELQPTQWIQLSTPCDNDLMAVPLKPLTDLLCQSKAYWTPLQLKELEKKNSFRYVPLGLTLSTPYHRYLLTQAIQTEFRSQDHLYKWMHHNLLFQPKEEDVVAQHVQSFYEKMHPSNSTISVVPS